MKEELSDKEKRLFEQLEREKMPSGSLEAIVIKRLKSEGLIETKTYDMNSVIKWAASVAAGVMLFFAGNYFGKQSTDELSINPAMGYMLILHEDDGFTPGEPYEMFKEYSAWMQNTAEKGITMTGQELKNTAVIIDSKENIQYLDAEAPNKATGYFILEAKSLEVAMEIAKSNPHINYGGSIEIKEYMVR